ncbi:hypothetical protein [Burkholderia stagnalis]|uniref:hypothetical protein n=1 Tax=Burkholderia stagnalis TaxID=1503054 RepID=UPI000F571D5E|nr:hypothetical protein [Burkholderia stagnalis]RQQ42461.1 hypothetical protein DF145_32185 [Burkholderia stagnalis]RQX88499.1 hypothetical protein DF121_32605 [Burkholderia stagnalis]RQY08124.1 hypothetical protein DF115_32035 [Burkholderia stagnalis]RQY23677.1 hypothetical protein DF114_32055 [Burkholderia stagnalis]
MNETGSSLRKQVDKWLAPSTFVPARVVRFSRMPAQRRRFVCVEAAHPAGTIAIFFFRHDDGSWCVFPPADRRPVMTARAA